MEKEEEFEAFSHQEPFGKGAFREKERRKVFSFSFLFPGGERREVVGVIFWHQLRILQVQIPAEGGEEEREEGKKFLFTFCPPQFLGKCTADGSLLPPRVKFFPDPSSLSMHKEMIFFMKY